MIKLMNLLFIYGPPASGKLTIAEEVAKLSDMKVFHNHLTQDLAKEIYPRFDEVRFGLVNRLRLATIQYVAHQGTSLVFTFVYSNDPEDDNFVSQVVDIVEGQDGKVQFVQLEAPDEVLLERVTNESRQRFHKLKDADILSARLKTDEYSYSVKQPDIFKLDSSKHTPKESATLIIEHFQLGSSEIQ